MAVYTEVRFEQAEAFVRALGRGHVTALHGIGPWTADVYLLFCLGHGDAYPFAISGPAWDKLRFVHETISSYRSRATSQGG